MAGDVELIVDAHAQVGEGAIWDADKQILYWVDILSNKLYVYDPASGQNKTYDVGQHVGTIVPRASGGVMLALYEGFAAYDLETGELTMIVDPEADLADNRFNDGKCDPAGRFWAGTMAYSNQSTQGSLYRLDPNMSVHKMVSDIGISNGLAWSLDHKTMYYIDTTAGTVRAFDYDNATGDISRERVIIQVPKGIGGPDGMTMDDEGMLWVAHFGGWRVNRWHPESGEILHTIELPTSNITSCAFGGPGLDTLYITSACVGMSEATLAEQPHAGGLFAVKPGYRGINAFKFAG